MKRFTILLMSAEDWVPGRAHPKEKHLIAGDVPGMWISTLEQKNLSIERIETLIGDLIEPLSIESGQSPKEVESTLRKWYKLS